MMKTRIPWEELVSSTVRRRESTQHSEIDDLNRHNHSKTLFQHHEVNFTFILYKKARMQLYNLDGHKH